MTDNDKRFVVRSQMDHLWGGMRWYVADTVTRDYATDQMWSSEGDAQREADALNRESQEGP